MRGGRARHSSGPGAGRSGRPHRILSMPHQMDTHTRNEQKCLMREYCGEPGRASWRRPQPSWSQPHVTQDGASFSKPGVLSKGHFVPPREHLAMAGDICGYHSWGGEKKTPARAAWSSQSSDDGLGLGSPGGPPRGGAGRGAQPEREVHGLGVLSPGSPKPGPPWGLPTSPGARPWAGRSHPLGP